MDAIISIVVSSIGAHYGNMDFFILYTCVSMGISIYKDILHYTNDKTAKR